MHQWVKNLKLLQSCGKGHGCGLDSVSLWLCSRPAAAAPMHTLAWERPYGSDVALNKKKKERKKKKISDFLKITILF